MGGYTMNIEPREGFEQFLDSCLDSDNRFLRAWAYNRFNELLLRIPRHREEMNRLTDSSSPGAHASCPIGVGLGADIADPDPPLPAVP